MTIENIQKIWTIIGTLIATLAPSFLPNWVVDLFGPVGTTAVFAAIGAVLALYQFFKDRTGAGKPATLKANGSKAYYALNPFAKA